MRRGVLRNIRSYLAPTEFIRHSEVDVSQAKFLGDECILVSEQDEPRGAASKLECHKWDSIQSGGRLHRAFSAFVFNAEHELLIQQRSKVKPTFPGLWSNTCCSHPLFTPEEMSNDPAAAGVKRATRRKLIHELNLHVREWELHYITRVLYKAQSHGNWGEHELDYIIFAIRDLDVRRLQYNKAEVAMLSAISKNALKEWLAKSPTQFTPWFRLIADKFLFHWWDHLNSLSSIVDHKTIYKLTCDK